MALETVVGEDPAQIRVPQEEDAVHVPHLTLVPVGTPEDGSGAGHGGDLVGVGLDPEPGVVSDAKKVVDDLEALATGGVVGAGDVHQCTALRLGVVTQEGEGGDDGGWVDVERELVLDDGELLDVLGET